MSSLARPLRFAVIYDDQLRRETTGTYCQRALTAFGEVRHFLPKELDDIPATGFDLYLNVDDGLDYQWRKDLTPSAWWAIDTHIGFERCLRRAQEVDLVFAAQRDGAERLQLAGISQAHWLPLAADPEIHVSQRAIKLYDFCFVGNRFPGPREELLRVLQQKFPQCFIGHAYFDDMARVYAASRSIFNRSIRNDINMRVFEALACGGFLLTNDLSSNGQAELFEDGEHCAIYTCTEELLDKLEFYLKRDDLRLTLAAAGRREVLRRHTYQHRMEQIIRTAQLHGSRVSQVGKSQSHTQSQPRSAVTELSYFSHARPELLSLIPVSAQHILEIGCGTGALGAAAKSRQKCRYIGVEINAGAAVAAKKRLDSVVVGDIDHLAIESHAEFLQEPFDCLVCGDVLEHMADPEGFLRRVHKWLTPQATLVASIPNARHHSLVTSLIEGNWTYEAAGLLDVTHRHFFTRNDILQLLEGAGFIDVQTGIVPGSGYDAWQKAGKPAEVHVGPLHLTGISVADAEEFYVYQYLVTATLGEGVGEREDMAVPSHETYITRVDSPPFGEGAISRACWERIREYLLPGMRTLECGSGLSTVLFEAAGCAHTALEHDPQHAVACNSVQVLPLVGEPPWYDWSPDAPFDLILIDGPPGWVGREGILRVLQDCIHSETIVILDDTNRPAERKLAYTIARRFNLQIASYRSPQRGFMILSAVGSTTGLG